MASDRLRNPRLAVRRAARSGSGPRTRDRRRATISRRLAQLLWAAGKRFGHGGSSATRGRGILFERLRVRPPWVGGEGGESGGGGEGEGGEGAEAKGGGGGGGGGERPPSKRQKRKRRAPWLDALYLSAFQVRPLSASDWPLIGL